MKDHNRGFTLIDLLISLAILSVAVLGLGAQFLAQRKALHQLKQKGDAYRVLQIIQNSLETHPIPHLTESGGPWVYFGCFDKRGFPVSHDSSKREIRPQFSVIRKPATRPAQSDLCVAQNFEVEIETKPYSLFQGSPQILTQYSISVTGKGAPPSSGSTPSPSITTLTQTWTPSPY